MTDNESQHTYESLQLKWVLPIESTEGMITAFKNVIFILDYVQKNKCNEDTIDKIIENDIRPITSGIRDEYDFFIAGTIMAMCSTVDDYSDPNKLMGLVREIIGKFIYILELAWECLDSKDENMQKANSILEQEVDITNLEAGMFLPKGYRELCALVNEKPLKSGSNSYKAQLKRWARYFKMEKGRGRSLVILDIYDEPLPVDDGRKNGNRNIYLKYIETILLYKAMEFALVSVAGSSVDLQDRFKELLTSDFSDLAANIESVGDAAESVSDELKQADNVAESFTNAWDSLKVSADDATKDLSNTLLGLAEKGRLTVDTFNEADSTGYFKNLGISADEAVSKINKLVDESKQLSSMSSQISSMAEALGTKKENGYVDADTLAGFDVEVRGLESWDKFQTVLGSTTSSYQECQDAANELATEWVNSSDFLAQLTEDTKEYYETQLESMGIENYEEVIESTLALKEAKEALAEIDLSEATEEEIQNLISEGEYSGLVAEQIWNLYAAKLSEQMVAIDSSADCAQLQALANDAMLTAEAVELLNQLMNIYNGLESGAYNGNRLLRDEAVEEAARIKAELDKLAKGEGDGLIVKPELKIKGSGGKKSGSGSGSGSSKSKSTAEEYDWIEQAIENVEKEIKELDKVANSSYSTFSEKNDALAKEIGKVTEEIELQQKAYDEYMRKADSIPLSEKYKELVRNGEIDIETINDDNLRQNISEYQKWYDKAQNVSDAIKQLKTDIKDLYVDTYKLQTDNLKDRLDSNSITEKQYLDGLKDAYERFYADLEDFAQQYHEAKLDYLDKEKDYLNNVASAAASLIDKEINNIRDDADEQENRIKSQIELLEDKKKPLQDELDALEEKAKRENLILNLQKAQYAQAKAENQRNKLVYTSDRGMIYTNDSEAIRDAKRDVDDAKLEIQKQSIQDQINALDKEIDRYNDLIDQINKAADAQIDALERIKNKWQEAIDLQKYAESVSILTGEFGDNAIEKILSGNDDDLLAQWKNSYITTLAEIDKESQGYIGNMTQQMASLYGIDLSSLQNQFQGVKESVDVVTNALGEAATAVGAGTSRNNDTTNKSAQSNDGNNKGTSLESAIQNETQTAMGAFDKHTDKITNEVIPAIQAATAEMNTFNESADVDIEKTITITYQTSGKPSDNISGNAHVEGTAKVNGDWEVQSNENYALVGEIGRELIVRNGKYFTVGDNGAEMFKIQKGDIVFNHEQTESLLKNGHISGHGKAYADGTVGGGKVITADGTILYPLQPGDRAWEVQKAFEPFINKIISGEMELVNTAMFEHQKQMEEMAKQINYVSSITNNRNVQPSINIGDIHVTCPGVTSQEVMHEVGDALNKQIGHLSQRAMQEAYKR